MEWGVTGLFDGDVVRVARCFGEKAGEGYLGCFTGEKVLDE